MVLFPDSPAPAEIRRETESDQTYFLCNCEFDYKTISSQAGVIKTKRMLKNKNNWRRMSHKRVTDANGINSVNCDLNLCLNLYMGDGDIS